MGNSKKLDVINQKIVELQKLQKQIEDDFVQNISKDIAKIIVKKKAYNVDKSALIKKIEAMIDNMDKS